MVSLERLTELRDNKCEICGSTKDLKVHYKDGRRWNVGLSNLQLLCKTCRQSEIRNQKVSESPVILDVLKALRGRPKDAYSLQILLKASEQSVRSALSCLRGLRLVRRREPSHEYEITPLGEHVLSEIERTHS